jgi:hypothetical protein
MGKKVYSSGISASDLADERPRNQGTNMAQMSGRVSAPPVDDATRTKAAANVRWLCPHDPEEILDALGLQPKPPAKRTARTFDCPTCGARAGAVCQDSNSTTMKRFHVARNKALTAWLKDNDEAEALPS